MNSYAQEFGQLAPAMQAQITATFRQPLSQSGAVVNNPPPSASMPRPSTDADLHTRDLENQRASELAVLDSIQSYWFDIETNILGATAAVQQTLGYPLLSVFEKAFPRRRLSLRFESIRNHTGWEKMEIQWQASNKHIACQAVIPHHFSLDVYTLACNDDIYLARFYADIVKRHELGILDSSLVSMSPHVSFLSPSFSFIPNWWGKHRWLRECKDERRRRIKTGYIVTWADVEYYAVSTSDRPYLYPRVACARVHEARPI